MTLAPLASAAEIEKIARNILVGARALGKFPTPIDEVIAYSELSLARGIEPSLITAGRLQLRFFRLGYEIKPFSVRHSANGRPNDGL